MAAAIGNARMSQSPRKCCLFLSPQASRSRILSYSNSATTRQAGGIAGEFQLFRRQAGWIGRLSPGKPSPMARYDFRTPRLFVDSPLREGAVVPLAREQANYLVNVLRLKAGSAVLLFNGRDGEWRAQLALSGRKSAQLDVETRLREQTPPCDLHCLFAPLKHARLDYMVQKAVELGASRLVP